MTFMKRKPGMSSEDMMADGPQKPGSLALAVSMKRKAKKMAMGGKVPGAEATNEPGVPARKPDDHRLDPADYMSKEWAGGPDPVRKPDDERLPQDEYMSDRFDASRRMASGGLVEGAEDTQEPSVPGRKPDDMRPAEDEYMSDHMAEGGEVPDASTDADTKYMTTDEQNQALREGQPLSNLYNPKPESKAAGGMISRAGSIAKAILEKRRMADGGMVELDNKENETPNYEQQNLLAAKKELYDDSQISAQPEDSNEHGDTLSDEDMDNQSMISQIRAKLRAKRGF